MDSFINLPFFDNNHRDLAARVSTFVEQEIEGRETDEHDVDDRARDYVTALARAGLLRYSVAAAETPLDLRSLCLIREMICYSSSLADLAFVMQGLGTFAISQAAPEHVRDFWLTRAAEGRAIAAFALTEADAGSDVAAVKTTATHDGDSWVIDGKKRFISNAGIADFYTVFARTGTQTGGRAELSAFVVSARMPGFSVVERTSHDFTSPHRRN